LRSSRRFIDKRTSSADGAALTAMSSTVYHAFRQYATIFAPAFAPAFADVVAGLSRTGGPIGPIFKKHFTKAKNPVK
jgi:hypothetical protein